MIVYLLILLVLVILVICTRNYKAVGGNPKEVGWFIKIFFKASYFIVDGIKNSKIIFWLCPHKVRKGIALITIARKKEAWRIYLANKIALLLLLLSLGSVFAIIIEVNSKVNTTPTELDFIKRNMHGMGSAKSNLKVRVDNGDEDLNIQLDIYEQKYSEEEIEEIFNEIILGLEEIILGENENLDEVRTDLNLITSYPDYPVVLEWSLEPYKGMDTTGMLIETEIIKEGIFVRLDVTLGYEVYKKEHSIYVTLLPRIKTAEQLVIEQILEAVSEVNRGREEEEEFQLPASLDGKSLVWTKEEQKNGVVIFFVFFVCAILIFIGKDYDLEAQIKKRRKQLTLDYPKIVGKLHILLGAGMTIQGAFMKIAFDYEAKKRDQGEKAWRYAYEEMLIVSYEMQSGVSEGTCYERFGERCQEVFYIKLGVLLSQNLRKGTKNMSDMLEDEMRNTLEIRKNLAKKLGEEAGTKLLFPMILMLFVVLVILIFPALLAFQI